MLQSIVWFHFCSIHHFYSGHIFQMRSPDWRMDLPLDSSGVPRPKVQPWNAFSITLWSLEVSKVQRLSPGWLRGSLVICDEILLNLSHQHSCDQLARRFHRTLQIWVCHLYPCHIFGRATRFHLQMGQFAISSPGYCKAQTKWGTLYQLNQIPERSRINWNQNVKSSLF